MFTMMISSLQNVKKTKNQNIVLSGFLSGITLELQESGNISVPFPLLYSHVQKIAHSRTLFLLMFFIFFFLYLHLSSPFKEEPSDVREEESHLRLRHGIHHQRHADRSQSDAEEWHGVAPPTVHVEHASLHVHATG